MVIHIIKKKYQCNCGHPAMKVELALPYSSLLSGHTSPPRCGPQITSNITSTNYNLWTFLIWFLRSDQSMDILWHSKHLFGLLSKSESYSRLSSMSSRSFTKLFFNLPFFSYCALLCLCTIFWSGFFIYLFCKIYSRFQIFIELFKFVQVSIWFCE